MQVSRPLALLLTTLVATLAGCASNERLSTEEGGGVEVADFSFEPAEVQVRPGEPVTWLNRDVIRHTVTADEESFDSGVMDQGGRFVHTFATAGVFAYHCEIHSQMRGSVRVAE